MERITLGRGPLGRRDFMRWVSTRTVGLGVAGIAGPALLAACANDDPTVPATGAVNGDDGPDGPHDDDAEVLVGDVVDFSLYSDDWPGEFGFVTLLLHHGLVDGQDVYFIRTDASDRDYAEREQLVWVPRIAPLVADDLSGDAFFVDGGVDGQGVVLSSQPGRDDYTPAWQVHEVTWRGEPRLLGSADEVRAAIEAGDLRHEETSVVLNAAVVKWSDGELAVDDERTGYLGPGQLLEPVDTSAMTVTFKLHQCYPASRYIVTDHSIPMAAEMTSTALSPRLQDGPTGVNATGRTNVFMNGIEGPGPMGFQPSAFDLDAGDPAWSPYWDHFTYAWVEGVEPRLLTTEQEVHAARDAGELEEFAGTPDTDGLVFTVNCPVPILAPPSFAP